MPILYQKYIRLMCDWHCIMEPGPGCQKFKTRCDIMSWLYQIGSFLLLPLRVHYQYILLLFFSWRASNTRPGNIVIYSWTRSCTIFISAWMCSWTGWSSVWKRFSKGKGPFNIYGGRFWGGRTFLAIKSPMGVRIYLGKNKTKQKIQKKILRGATYFWHLR